MTPLSDLARSMFLAAIDAVAPGALMRRLAFTERGVGLGEHACNPAGRLHLVALGKAGPGLAAAFLQRSQRVPETVFVLAPDGVPAPDSVAPYTRRASHPVPDARGAAATRELLELMGRARRDDGIVVLLSGGSSALLAAPLDGADPGEVAALTRALLAAPLPISDLNAVRKHLLAASGGRLALASAAPLLTLVLSDVPGNDLATVASGPTVADPTTFADAVRVLERAGLAGAFPGVDRFLAEGARGEHPESPKPGDHRLGHAQAHLLGSSADALAAAAETARAAGLRACELTRTLRGEARTVGTTLGCLARSLTPGEGTALLLAGETTVQVRGGGRGGRSLELALAAALALAEVPERCLLAAGSDGVDGAAPAAGAVVDGGTIGRAAERGRDALDALERNDSWPFFDGLPEAIVTGPTGVNVADLVFVLAAGAPADFLPANRRQALRVPGLAGGALRRRGRPGPRAARSGDPERLHLRR